MPDFLIWLQSPAALALIGTIFGGVGLKLVENLLTKSKTKTDIASDLRKELRQDVLMLREEIRRVEANADQWKEKYYDILAEMIEVRRKLLEFKERLDDCESQHPKKPRKTPAQRKKENTSE